MKYLLTLSFLLVSGIASASIKVPCATDFVKVKSVSYNVADNTTDVKVALLAEDEETGRFARPILLKTISYALEGQVAKSDVKTDLNIRINVFRRIRICELTISAK